MSEIDIQNAKNIRDMMEVIVEVQATINGSVQTFTYTNEDLLSVELNLRSDLSPIDPTLPESEIVVRVYCDEDVSDIVKYIADDQPLTYKAGYNGTYCTTRKFYISEPVIWSDKVLTYKAVDAVHFLNNVSNPIWDSSISTSNMGHNYLSYTKRYSTWKDITTNYTASFLACVFNYYVKQSGVTVLYDHNTDTSFGGTAVPAPNAFLLIPSGSPREHIANMMNLVRLDFPSGAFNVSSFYLTYVDAGIPIFKRNKPTSSWDIYEIDCGDIKENTARDIVKISPQNMTLLLQTFRASSQANNSVVGSITITKQSGASVSLNTFVPMALAKTSDNSAWYTAEALGSVQYEIQRTPSYSQTPYSSTYAFYCYNEGGFVPWDTRLESFWNSAVSSGDIANDATEATFDLYGAAMIADKDGTEYTKTGYGTVEQPTKTMWYGTSQLKGQDGVTYKFLPDMGFEQLLNRSNKTGSFTWKGDPRMQPRDVFTWHFLDGTTELRTIETINLKHEGGGTVATITYRKGIV